MEPDVAAELAVSTSQHGAQVTVLVGDDDSCTIKKVRESVTHEVDKWSDTVHAKRSFGTSLYTLQKNYKGTLSNKVINYLLKCFGYALSQNKCNVQGLQKNLRAIVPHTFGTHEGCDASWCGFLQDPTTYTHKSLPHGKDLRDEKLQEDLKTVVEVFAKNAEKLAPLGSSQPNESLNNSIGSKAPKIRHYGASQSNDYRVACAVSQKNLGYSYVTEVGGCRSMVHVNGNTFFHFFIDSTFLPQGGGGRRATEIYVACWLRFMGMGGVKDFCMFEICDSGIWGASTFYPVSVLGWLVFLLIPTLTHLILWKPCLALAVVGYLADM